MSVPKCRHKKCCLPKCRLTEIPRTGTAKEKNSRTEISYCNRVICIKHCFFSDFFAFVWFSFLEFHVLTYRSCFCTKKACTTWLPKLLTVDRLPSGTSNNDLLSEFSLYNRKKIINENGLRDNLHIYQLKVSTDTYRFVPPWLCRELGQSALDICPRTVTRGVHTPGL